MLRLTILNIKLIIIYYRTTTTRRLVLRNLVKTINIDITESAN